MAKTVTFAPEGKDKANSTYATDAKAVWLPERGLKTLDPAIGEFTECTELDLSSNELETLPAELGALKALKSLTVSGNEKLASLPDSLANCKKLRKLTISHTKISTLPLLPGLEVLHADNVPTIDLESVLAHKNLTTLNLAGCKIKKADQERLEKAYPESYVVF